MGAGSKTQDEARPASSGHAGHGDRHGAIELPARGVQAIDDLVVNVGVIDTAVPMAIGIDLEQGGFLVNAGTIEATGYGGTGVRLVAKGTAGAVVINASTIIGGLDGIDLPAGGLVINAPGAVIDGRSGDGIAASGAPGTIVDAGTIAGGTDAIAFSGSFADRVILSRGAVLGGKVMGGSGTNTLELARGAPGTATLAAFGGEFVDFGTLAVDGRADWAFANAVTIGGGVTLTDAGTLANAGRIESTVTVATGGLLVNRGVIEGGAGGGEGSLAVLSSGSVSNGGTIGGGDGGTIVSAGGTGILLLSGGSVSNTGTVSGGHGGSTDSFYGSAVGGAGGTAVVLQAAGTVINGGTMAGGAGGDATGPDGGFRGGDGGGGIRLEAGGDVSNRGVVSGGAGGSAGLFDGLFYTGGGGAGIVLQSGGVIDNGGTVSGGTGHDVGGYLGRGGDGGDGIVLAAGALTNSGSILGGAGGSLYEVSGLATYAGAGAAGVMLQAAGTVTNSGTIAGGAGGGIIAYSFPPGPDRYDAMKYDGVGGVGLLLDGGGVVTNMAGGLIAGNDSSPVAPGRFQPAGIAVYGGAGTIANTGTISGAEAVVFSGSYADRVILDPGAVLIGAAVGGSGTNTLELATGAPGGAGTLTGLDTGFTGFGTVTLDAGAAWMFDGTDAIGAGMTLRNAGAIIAAVTIGSGGSLDNGGVIAGEYGVSVAGTGSAGVTGASQSVVTNGGSILGGTAGTGSTGGAGISTTDGLITNSGRVAGGAGGGTYGGPASSGGVGVLLSGGSLANTGTIVGGNGGTGAGYSGAGASGGVGLGLTGGTLTNSGVILGGYGGTGHEAGGTGGIGVTLRSGGLLQNSGTIGGAYGGGAAPEYPTGGGGSGIALYAVATVVNSGTIDGAGGGYESPGGVGIALFAGGVVDNTGRIGGGRPGFAGLGYAPGASGITAHESSTITNSGTILVDYTGYGFDRLTPVIDLGGGGVITNAAGGLITSSGYVDIAMSGGPCTITNAGTISSTLSGLPFLQRNLTAISFSGSYADRVILDPGAVLSGNVAGGTGTNTLELAAGVAGSVGTVASFGAAFTSFGTIVMDSGAHWLLNGASGSSPQSITLSGSGDVLALDDASGVHDPIVGFVQSDALDLRDLGYSAGATTRLVSDTLTVTSDGSSNTLIVPGLSGATRFELTDDGSGHLLVGNAGVGTSSGSAPAPRFLAGSVPRDEASLLQHAAPLMQAAFRQMLGGAAPVGTTRPEVGALPDAAPAWHPVAVALGDRSVEHVLGLHHNP